MKEPLEAAASIVLLEFRDSYGLAFVAPNGRIVTSFHVVVEEPEITAHFADGRAMPVTSVAAIDTQRDLAVLDVGLLDVAPAKAPGPRMADEGMPAYVFGMVQTEGRARWVNVKIAAIQVLGGALTVYRLEGEVPPDASGGPLIAQTGEALGVVTVAESDHGVVTLAVPWRYVEPLVVKNAGLPLSALARPTRKTPTRNVPQHPLSMLEGSSVAGLEATTNQLAQAIRLGAPAYNDGDIDGCYRLYSETARQLISARSDCPGVKEALVLGLKKAESLQDVDHRAWAMRDVFDGLIELIDRFLRARATVSAPKGQLLN